MHYFIPLNVDDQVFLHEQERVLKAKLQNEGTNASRYSKLCYLPTKADLFVLEYHKWLGSYANSGPWGPDYELPPPLSHEDLLDRYALLIVLVGSFWRNLHQMFSYFV